MYRMILRFHRLINPYFLAIAGQRGERLAKVGHHHAAKLCSLRGGYRPIDPVGLADFRRVAV